MTHDHSLPDRPSLVHCATPVRNGAHGLRPRSPTALHLLPAPPRWPRRSGSVGSGGPGLSRSASHTITDPLRLRSPSGAGSGPEEPKETNMAVISMRELLQAGVHFGHQTRRWNPKMKRFIHGERNGIYIIDLEQTLTRIETAYTFVRDLVAGGGTILFVGTKKQAQDAVRSYADRCGMPYVNERWLGGMLTNFQTMVKRVGKMKEYQRMRDTGELAMLPKKEALLISRELEKLERNLSGIRDLEKLPQAIFVIDTKKEAIAVVEANKLGIPIVAVVDTNCDPDIVQYVIPGNDDAIRAGNLMCRIISDAVEEGHFIRSRRTGGAGPAPRGEEEERRVAAQQAEARRAASQAASEREARIAARLTEPRSQPGVDTPADPSAPGGAPAQADTADTADSADTGDRADTDNRADTGGMVGGPIEAADRADSADTAGGPSDAAELVTSAAIGDTDPAGGASPDTGT